MQYNKITSHLLRDIGQEFKPDTLVTIRVQFIPHQLHHHCVQMQSNSGKKKTLGHGEFISLRRSWRAIEDRKRTFTLFAPGDDI